MAQTGSADAPSRQHISDFRDGGQFDASPSGRSFSRAQVHAALRQLPSHGWTTGWTGRRDRALLVLSQMAGLPYESIAQLTVADIKIADGTATISTPGGSTTLHMADDGLICGPCALARWIHALDMTALYPNGAVIAAVIARCAPLTSNSPHLCQGTVTVTEATQDMAVLPTTDAWGRNPIAETVSDTPRVDVRTRTRSAGGGEFATIPTQRTVIATKTILSPIGLNRSNYTRADREQSPNYAERLAHGLEGRAQHLLTGASIE